jgi:hypothetical protein
MSFPVDSRTRALWLFDERHDGVLPSDASGYIADDLAPGATNALPPVTETDVGAYGREFAAASLTGLEAEDTDDALQLGRNVSILCLLDLDVTAQNTAGAGTIVSLAERTVRLSMFWGTEAGGSVADTGVEFAWPATGEELLLCATREAVDGQLQVTYFVSGLSATSASTWGLSVGTGTGENVWVGVGYDGGYQQHLSGVLSYLEIVADAVTAEEFEWIWKRMSIDEPEAVAAIRRMVPPDVYSDEPSSAVQIELANEGRIFGLIRNYIRLQDEYFKPAKAFGERLETWEQITKLAPKPGDWIARRRARVGAFLEAQEGFSVPSVQQQLEEVFNLAAADIEILEYDNERTYDFATDPADYVQSDGAGTWTISGGVATFASATEGVWIGRGSAQAGALLWSLGSGDDCFLSAKVTIAGGTAVAAQGITLGRSINSEEWVSLTCTSSGGTTTIYRTVVAAGVSAAPVSLGNVGAATTVYLVMRHSLDGEMTLRFGTSFAAAVAATPATYSAGFTPDWGGLIGGLVAAGSIDADFDDVIIRTPQSDDRFHWYAYRDPALGGTYDLEGADQVVRRIKPAHTYARAIDAPAVLCDTAGAGCDRGPIGK